MNMFNALIEAHEEWKLKLINQINQGQMTDDFDAIMNSHLCELSQWVNDVGGRYSYLTAFKIMRSAHEEFHSIAGELAAHVKACNFAKVRELMSHGGTLRQSSNKLITALVECGKEINSPAMKGISVKDTINDILREKTKKSVITIEGDATVLDAIKLMVQHNVGSLAVYTKGIFIGFFTERGYLRTIAQKGVETSLLPIAEMIDLNTIYVQRDDSIERCMMLMTSARTRHLPVIQEGRLIGIVSIGDIVKKVVRYDV